MAPIRLSNPIIPPGSLILVTGVNGLIASHIADQLLQAGYSVRGTARDLSKSSWVVSLLGTCYGPDRFQLVGVSDLAEPGVWPHVVQGCAGIVSVAAGADLMSTKSVDESVTKELAGFHGLLDAARESGTVKSVVYTSSFWAALDPKPGVEIAITETTYNDDAVRVAEDPSIPQADKGIKPFMAVKVKVEKALWEWVGREKPPFRFNTVLPDTVIGPILDPDNQPASTAGFVRGLWNNDARIVGITKFIAPQWYVDARDCGKLYVAVLTTAGVDRERIFGCAEKFSWPKILEIFRELYPGKAGLPELEDAGWDMSTVPRERALELLRSVGQNGWTGLDESVRDTVESFAGEEELASLAGRQNVV